MVQSGDNLVKIGKEESPAISLVEVFYQLTAHSTAFRMRRIFASGKNGKQQCFVGKFTGQNEIGHQGFRSTQPMRFENKHEPATWKNLTRRSQCFGDGGRMMSVIVAEDST